MTVSLQLKIFIYARVFLYFKTLLSIINFNFYEDDLYLFIYFLTHVYHVIILKYYNKNLFNFI